MRRKLFLVLVFVFALGTNTLCFETLPFLWHVHTQGWSDGSSTVTEVAKNARSGGMKGVFYSDHSDMHISDHSDSFWWYQKETQQFNQEGAFIVLTGREITIGSAKGSNHHLNAYSENSTPYLFNPNLTLDQVLKKVISDEDGFAVYNHPHTSLLWCDQVNKFSGIEIFNEYHTTFDMNCYLKALKKGWRGFVVGGMDLHSMLYPNAWLNVKTYIFPDQFTKQSTIEAIKNGKTIATRGVWGVYVSYPPSSFNQPMNKLQIIIKLKEGLGNVTKKITVNIYKNGNLHKKITAQPSPKQKGVYAVEVMPKESGCYVFEMVGYLVTSPYCY
ncbi:MAG TPA: hypothetical protein P5096_03440 [Patescibacteria group bacterium]|nr:hypothetical protein [Patescibacteria group bacterium]